MIETERELDENLSEPTPEVADELVRLGGDVVVLGAAGKMGPTLARMARRALDRAGSRNDVIAVSRFSNPRVRTALGEAGVRTIGCDLLDGASVAGLPDAAGVVFMAGTKFGTTGGEATTWATNAWLPGLVANRYRGVPTVAFSTGNVYPLVPVAGGGATEKTPTDPIGEYGQSALGRERVFEFFSRRDGTPVAIVRLNYAVELRYGVLVDIARKVFAGDPIDLRMGWLNVIWQGDANAAALRCFAIAASPPAVVNVTGPMLAVRRLAERFGEIFGRPPVLHGAEESTALVADASEAMRRFGPWKVPIDTVIEWVAAWVARGGATLGKPTHFETRDGRF